MTIKPIPPFGHIEKLKTVIVDSDFVLRYLHFMIVATINDFWLLYLIGTAMIYFLETSKNFLT